MQATTVLPNHEVQSSLSHLARKLARLCASDPPPRTITSRRRRAWRLSWVCDAVVRVLADHGGPMRVKHAPCGHRGIARREPVSKDSVGWIRSSDVPGSAPRFARVARGRYVMASTE
jgi:hypothetical protein